MTNKITLNTIGVVHSPYKQKFAIPRQSGLVPQAVGRLELLSPYNHIDTVRELQQFSHVWLLFVFHETQHDGWNSLVRPPRLGGNKKVGVFASRATHRPNPLGMSVVKLERIYQDHKKLFIEVSGIDLLDKTPIVDIKPYIPYSDSLLEANGGYAAVEPSRTMSVKFSHLAREQLDAIAANYHQLEKFIINVLKQDPRPAYKPNGIDQKIYGVELYDLDVKWSVSAQCTTVLEINTL
jgi:tRNA-Thr(GGU) m(6)t(6)A37 methyltransferase TsaA